METLESIIINSYLKTLTKVPIGPPNVPMFRLVWSDDALEMRTGEYAVYYNGIYLHTKVGTRQTLKYNWIKARWILEQWYPPEVAMNDELPESNMGSYEPIYVFEDAKRNPLQLNLKAIQIIIHNVMKPKRSSAKMKTDIKDEFAAIDTETDKYFYDVLNDDGPLVSLLHFGEAGMVPHNYDVESPNLRNKGNESD